MSKLTGEKLEAFRARVRAEVATWPPLTEEQQRVIAYNLYGIGHNGRKIGTGPSEYELKQRKEAYERDEALKKAKKAAEAMTACDVCNLQPEAHRIRQANSVDMHQWQPGRAEKLMKRTAK